MPRDGSRLVTWLSWMSLPTALRWLKNAVCSNQDQVCSCNLLSLFFTSTLSVADKQGRKYNCVLSKRNENAVTTRTCSQLCSKRRIFLRIWKIHANSLNNICLRTVGFGALFYWLCECVSVCAHAYICTQDLEGRGLKFISEEGGSIVLGWMWVYVKRDLKRFTGQKLALALNPVELSDKEPNSNLNTWWKIFVYL